MSALINDLLDLSRVSRGRLRRESVNLTELALATVAELQRKDSACRVVFEIAEGLSATADRHLVKLVL